MISRPLLKISLYVIKTVTNITLIDKKCSELIVRPLLNLVGIQFP